MTFQDFSGQNLRGRSFKGQNLEGANFSNADIRGANFTGTNLTGANFSCVKAGLQLRWTFFLVLVSCLVSGISGCVWAFNGALVSLILDTQLQSEYRFIGWAILIILIAFFFIIIRQGLGSRAGIFALFTALTLIFALALVVAIAIAKAGTAVLIVVGTIAGAITGSVAIAGAIVGAVAGAVALNIAGTIALAVAGSVGEVIAVGGAIVGTLVTNKAIAAVGASSGILLSNYIAWQAMKQDEKYSLVHNFAIVIAETVGTSFYKADLTDTNFTEARLKNTDFRQAILTRTCFYQTKEINSVRPGTSYLQDSELRQMLITRDAKGKIFENKILQGLNLSKVDFAYANLINTNFYQSSLEEANLEGALLVKTQLESTVLTGATLTGACIEDWIVTKTTKLDNVECKYIFMKLNEKGDKCDQMPLKGEFKKNDFINFVQSILGTIKLYHERDINPTLALYVLQSLSEEYECTLEIVKVEKEEKAAQL